jgi:hypothetical protein
MVKSLEPVGVDRYLRDDHILDEPFSVALLIDLGFSADALDPLFDSGIFREPLPNRAEGSSLRARAAAKLPRTQEFEGAIWLARTVCNVVTTGMCTSRKNASLMVFPIPGKELAEMLKYCWKT